MYPLTPPETTEPPVTLFLCPTAVGPPQLVHAHPASSPTLLGRDEGRRCSGGGACPTLTAAPTIAPKWISGPSGPMGSPEDTARIVETILTHRACRVKTCAGGKGGGGG